MMLLALRPYAGRGPAARRSWIGLILDVSISIAIIFSRAAVADWSAGQAVAGGTGPLAACSREAGEGCPVVHFGTGGGCEGSASRGCRPPAPGEGARRAGDGPAPVNDAG